MKNFDFEELQPLTNEEIREHASDCNGEPAIYLGTYHKYNCGSIYGQWIDITSFDDYDEFCDYCKRLHLDEDDPEKRCKASANKRECSGLLLAQLAEARFGNIGEQRRC